MRPRFLSSADIAESAARFRKQYAPLVRGQLDIEAILEHDLRLEIVPRPDLSRRTGKKGWLSCDGRRIYVDEGLMCCSPREYRFTIAHEGAHAVLHRDLLPAAPLRTAEDFWAYHSRLTERDQFFLEWQAREWAGRVLVPPDELAAVFRSCVRQATRVCCGPTDEALIPYVEWLVARHFGVTSACAHVRIEQDRLWARMGISKIA